MPPRDSTWGSFEGLPYAGVAEDEPPPACSLGTSDKDNVG